MKIAVSACLLGEKIRFDGGHKHDHFVTDALGSYASFLPFCPEHLAFGTPRPSIRLVRHENATRAHTNKDGSDVTDPLIESSRRELEKIALSGLCGIIFKSKSPSCGMGSAKFYLENGFCEGKEDGLFAQMCKERFPLLPMEEEGRLSDPWLRENFIMQLFAYARFETFKQNAPSFGELVRFHTVHKFLLQSKNEMLYRQLGRVIANHDNLPANEVIGLYEPLFKTAISHKSSIKRTRNVLEHMSGFFKNDLSSEEKTILHGQIRDYAQKIVPLIVPLSTIHLFASKYRTAYLLEQIFIDPYPKELALRSYLDSGK
ncbi:MAG: YbgA family protein [Sulfuricurvum sp.]